LKLISLHVEKFGNLTDYSMDFTDGLNRVLKDNGWGKSTLAAFIRVMFYGLEGKGLRKDLTENDKARYTPWEGGAFGGSVIFEAGGKRYILSRNFADKTKGKPVLQDADTLLESNDYSDKIGEELFGIDSESYKKTAFIDRDNIRYLGANSKIASKVSVLSQTDDLDRFDEVDKQLSVFEVQNSDGRKTGNLYLLNEEILSLENEIKKETLIKEETERAKEEKSEIIRKEETLKAKRKELSEKIKKLSENRGIAANYAHYLELKEKCGFRERELNRKKTVFAGGIPSSEKLDELEELNRDAEQKKLLLKRGNASENEDRYEHLKRYFKDNPPSEETVISKLEICNRMQKLSEENDRLEKEIASLKTEINNLEIQTGEEKRLLSEKERELQKLREGCRKEEADFETEIPEGNEETVIHPAEPEGTKMSAWLFVSAAILFGIGIVLILLYFLMNRMLGILGAGILFLMIGFAVFLAGSMRRKKERKQRLYREKLMEEKKAAEEKRKQEIQDRQKREMLERQKKRMEAEYEIKLLESKIADLEEKIKKSEISLTEKNNSVREKNNAVKENLEKSGNCESDLKEFFNRYEIPFSKADVEDTLFEMKSRIPEYRSLRKSKEQKEEEYRKLTEQSKEADEKLNSFYASLGGTTDSVPDYGVIRAFVQSRTGALKELKNAEKELDISKENLQAFLEEHREFAAFEKNENAKSSDDSHFIVMSEEETEREYHQTEELIADADREKDSLVAELNRINGKLDQLAAETDRLHILSEKLTERKEEAEELKQSCYYNRLTREYLNKAKDRFVARYMSPIKERFDRYMKIMAHTGFVREDDYQIDAGLHLKKKELGSYRDIAYLSEGYSDMVGICIRLALLDVMYQNEKPLIIMDDPFGTLDRNHLDGAKEFLEKAAEEYQILYFTCNEDRL